MSWISPTFLFANKQRFHVQCKCKIFMSTKKAANQPTTKELTKLKEPGNVLDIPNFLVRKLLTGRPQHIFVVARDLHLIISYQININI